jgi:hypothetical protein
MAVYRLRSVGGALRPATAGRVLVVDGEVRFQSPGTGGWVTVDSAPLDTVLGLERRFNEADGRVRWVADPEVNAAAAAARPDPPADAEEEAAAGPAVDRAGPPAGAAARKQEAPASAASARDVRCPRCGETEELSGRRVDGAIVLTCHTCGYDGPRVASRRCRTCGGSDVVERPKALVERSRGTQLSVVGYTTVGLCRACDADDLAAALKHGGVVLPEELPTVDPQTLRELGRGMSRQADVRGG